MRKVTIPIDDDEDNGSCNVGYIVKYKVSTDGEYTQMFPNPVATPIVINGLEDDTLYDIQIQRMCCDGTISVPAEFQVDTTIV